MFFSTYNDLSLFIKRHFFSLVPFLTFNKAFNVIRVLLDMKLRNVVCSSRPFIFRIDPFSLCNLRCPSCGSWKTQTKEKRVMEFDDYTKIIDKIKRSALRVSLYDLGEPLAHKRIYDMIKYASDNAISTLISSNFNLFIKDDINKLFESKLTVLEPCLDGFSQENYEKYRKNGSVSKVKDGIVAVMGYKTTHKMKYPIVDVQVIKFDCIKHEMPAIDNFLRNECKVDKITYRQEILGFNSEETTIAYKNVSSDAPCFWLYLGMLIRPDGRVYPCCGNGFDRFAYGNILESNLKDIWNNKYYCFSRELFRKGKPLDATGEFKKVPCITCNKYKKQRKVIFS